MINKILNEIFSLILPSVSMHKANKKLNDKLKDNDNYLRFNASNNIEVENLKVLLSDSIDIKSKIEDKAKLNIPAFSVVITIILGASDFVNDIYAKFNNKSILSLLLIFIFIVAILYMLSAIFISVQMIVNNNAVYKISVSSLENSVDEKTLKEDYKRAINCNSIVNTIRNNMLFTSYMCVRNAMACFFIIFVVLLVPVENKNDTSDKGKMHVEILYNSNVLQKLDYIDTNVEQIIINYLKDEKNLKDGKYEIIVDKKNIVIEVIKKDNYVTIMNIDVLDGIKTIN